MSAEQHQRIHHKIPHGSVNQTLQQHGSNQASTYYARTNHPRNITKAPDSDRSDRQQTYHPGLQEPRTSQTNNNCTPNHRTNTVRGGAGDAIAWRNRWNNASDRRWENRDSPAANPSASAAASGAARMRVERRLYTRASGGGSGSGPFDRWEMRHGRQDWIVQLTGWAKNNQHWVQITLVGLKALLLHVNGPAKFQLCFLLFFSLYLCININTMPTAP